MAIIINGILQGGISKLSNGPYFSPMLPVYKKDGTWHFCVDYHALRVVTIHDCFLIPTIDELFNGLFFASIFYNIDLRPGYHQIRVTLENTHKMTFRTFDGHCDFLVMPFDLTNAPRTFQSVMKDFLRPYLHQFFLVFFDDILIYNSCLSDHVCQLQLILELLVSNQCFAKISKICFCCF